MYCTIKARLGFLRKSLWGVVKRCKSNDKKKDNFLTPTSAQYLDYLYELWRKDPKTVNSSWDSYFKLLDSTQVQSQPKQMGVASKSYKVASDVPVAPSHFIKPEKLTFPKQSFRAKSDGELKAETDVLGALQVNAMIRAYQARGHLIADTDPLKIQNPESHQLKGSTNLPPELVVRKHMEGMTEADMNREFQLGAVTVIGGDKKSLPLKDIITRLNDVYCGHLGLEYTYIHDLNVVEWLRHKFEIPGVMEVPNEDRVYTWRHLMRGVLFENYLAKKYTSVKRFGLEGCESFIPATLQCIDTCVEHGTESVMIGMAHRGRLCTLVNVCAKPMSQLLTQFNPALQGFGSGDVKYHLGTLSEKLLEKSGRTIRIGILANPSHLEAVDPVVIGRVRAELVDLNDEQVGTKCLAILVHGDAAFSGQGVCYETINFTNLQEYKTGGVIHMVINNQIGFTTDPRYSRSSAHCTDIGRVVNAPIFHVHADDPDLVTYCSKVAGEYRTTFNNDVVVDVVGYRRYGHNEMDEPMLTQPLMYKKIKEHPNVLDIYTEKLLKEGVVTEDFVNNEKENYLNYCEEEFKKAQSINVMELENWTDTPWFEFMAQQSADQKIPSTGISMEDIRTICTAISTPPKDIEAHAQVHRAMKRRKKLMEEGKCDWAMGECLAFASLLKEGHLVRLSGQDVERGTFSHRMHVIHDQNRDKVYKNILHDIFPNQARYTVSNSSLSEYGVLGFELGYATYDYNALVIWEAQFGDFANNCQVVIDNFICAGETKWGRQVGLTMLLPHGAEGQGPEHSSARIERFLLLCDDSVEQLPSSEGKSIQDTMTQQLFECNWIICNLTTPANLFHAFRRQIKMPFRKPLVIMSPKFLLRHPMAVSDLDDCGPDTSFEPLIGDTMQKGSEVKKILLCSGKVYYELVNEREKRGLADKIAIVRIEQLSPFPYRYLMEEVERYPESQIMWVQEEHRNDGAYCYVRNRIALALDLPLERVRYGGKNPSASPATGSKVIYDKEVENMLEAAMTID